MCDLQKSSGQVKIENLVIDTSKAQLNENAQLQMVLALIGDKTRKFILDDGSQVSLVPFTLIEELGLFDTIKPIYRTLKFENGQVEMSSGEIELILTSSDEVKQVAKKTWRSILSNLNKAAESSLDSNQAALTETSSTPKSSTSSLHYQQKLSNEDFLLLKSLYESIQNKWVLRSGTYMEDVIYEASRKFIYKQ